ncbi:hypothetical protein Glove_229g143 [Diversispora epigaea]|uniref:Uncharacterized protein n=1 Tax=Diversispora epigaea TaxID=1348612 RepID=A0A397ID06_9GLOM|nr:hypothetical protein Glove_229g143 [Diversispora epigaea]
MLRAERNRNLFASAIAGSTSSGSTTSRRARLGTNPSEPYLVEEERATTTTRTETNSINRLIRKFELFEKKMDSLLNDNADIKKRLKNIELLTEINNDPDFSKDVINRVAKNIFKANIFPSTKDLIDETEHVIRKNFPDISELMDSRHHSKLFTRIKAKLLEKLRGMRSGIASRVKLAIFEIFGESQLPRIDFQSSPAEINSWKSDQRVKDAYRKLFDVFSEDRTYVQVILERVWKSKKRISNMHIAWGVAIAQLFLNPDVKGIMISENLLKKQIKINFRKLQQKRPLRPEEGELDVEETSEEESEEEEEEGKSPKRRKTSRGHVPSSGRAPSPGLVSPPLTSPSLKSAIFEIFGESQLPRIDFQSSLAEINSWKSDQRVKDAYRKLFDVFSEDRTYVQVILERVWKSKKRISNMHIAWGVAIAQLFLNPDVKGIMISENLLKKQIKINFRKLQQKRPLRSEEGELDAEETSEEESEEEEEEGKNLKRRKTSRGHVPSPGRAPSPGRVSPPLISPSRLLPEFFDNEGEGRQRAREGRRESRRQYSQEGWRESRQRSGEEEGDTTGGDTERAEIIGEQ